jgi:hypothetical protein
LWQVVQAAAMEAPETAAVGVLVVLEQLLALVCLPDRQLPSLLVLVVLLRLLEHLG